MSDAPQPTNDHAPSIDEEIERLERSVKELRRQAEDPDSIPLVREKNELLRERKEETIQEIERISR